MPRSFKNYDQQKKQVDIGQCAMLCFRDDGCSNQIFQKKVNYNYRSQSKTHQKTLNRNFSEKGIKMTLINHKKPSLNLEPEFLHKNSDLTSNKNFMTINQNKQPNKNKTLLTLKNLKSAIINLKEEIPQQSIQFKEYKNQINSNKEFKNIISNYQTTSNSSANLQTVQECSNSRYESSVYEIDKQNKLWAVIQNKIDKNEMDTINNNSINSINSMIIHENQSLCIIQPNTKNNKIAQVKIKQLYENARNTQTIMSDSQASSIHRFQQPTSQKSEIVSFQKSEFQTATSKKFTKRY